MNCGAVGGIVVMASIGATLITNLLNSANSVQRCGAGISRSGVTCERRRMVCSGHEDFKLRAGSFTCNPDSINSRKVPSLEPALMSLTNLKTHSALFRCLCHRSLCCILARC